VTEISSLDPTTLLHVKGEPATDRIWLLGLPFDSVTLRQAVALVRSAARERRQLSIATPNVNFMAIAMRDPEFRGAVLDCDLYLVDGMPIVWLSQLAGPRLPERVSGSSLFDELAHSTEGPPLRTFFFGGGEGIAEQAARNVARMGGGINSAGWLSPGFGSLDEMESEEIVSTINDSGADLLLVAIGAKRGHLWMARNRHRLHIPVIAYLGATINFVAGNVRRAPRVVQRMGLEWVWRIGQEPKLLSRYVSDGVDLGKSTLRMLREAMRRARRAATMSGTLQVSHNTVKGWSVAGVLSARTLPVFREVAAKLHDASATLDVAGLAHVDSAGLGALFNLLALPDAVRPRILASRRPCKAVRKFAQCLQDAGHPSIQSPAPGA
jgi:N-acetylglucosaminyldiphosphoundecaprenol N-acetyl-beta-D-mannosaminyltransferase